MTQNQIRSGGAPRAEKPPELSALPGEAAGQAADDEEVPVAQLPGEAAGQAADDEEITVDQLPGEAAGQPADDEEIPVDQLPGEAAGQAADDEGPFEDEEPERAERPKLPLSERLKRTPPAVVILTIAAVGSSGFLVWQLASRTAPISVLTSSAVVTGLVYVAVTIVCTIATYQAGYEGRTGRAFLLAFIGGISAIIAALSFAGGLVLFLALGF
jgi:hypothetical protein